MTGHVRTALAPPVAPLACPKCERPFGAEPCQLVEHAAGGFRVIATCVGCGSRLWLYLGAIDANGVGMTHLVPL